MKFKSKPILITTIIFIVVSVMITACGSTDEDINTEKQNDTIEESTSVVTGIDDKSDALDVEINEEIDRLKARNEIIIRDTTNTDAYVYPLRGGTPEWKAMKSTIERRKACQIPQPILQEMSTEGLVITVLNYPFYRDIFLHNTPQGGFEAVAERFNGLEEFLQRDDAGIELLAFYKTMDPLDVKENWISSQIGCYAQNFSDVEILLCQDDILDDFSESQLVDLIKEAKEKYREKEQSEIFSIYSIADTARVIGKVLQHAEFEQFLSEIHQNENLEEFLTTGVYRCDDSVILSNMEQFLTR